MTQARCLEDADQQVAAAHLALAEHQAAVYPAALDGFFHLRGKVGDRGRTARQPVQRIGQVAGQARRLDIELAHDTVQVAVLQLQQLVQPVHQFDIGVAPQLAEHRCGLDGLVGDAVEFAEQRGAADFTHGPGSLYGGRRPAGRRNTGPASGRVHRAEGGQARYRSPGVGRH